MQLNHAVAAGIVLALSLPATFAATGSQDAVSPARLRALSAAYLGVPYKLDCLGEACAPDADPLFDRKRADCQTLVEQVMAEAIAPEVGGLEKAVRLTRYRGSVVGLGRRYHYCIPDWLDNPWPAVDVTGLVGEGVVKNTTRRIDRTALLASRGLSAKIPVQRVSTAYIPREKVGTVLAKIPDGSIGIFVLNRGDIVSGHLGFLFRTNGKVVLRHASQTRRKVIDEPLTTYLARAPKRFIGMQILQPSRAGLRRG
jgi:hypothetical protein